MVEDDLHGRFFSLRIVITTKVGTSTACTIAICNVSVELHWYRIQEIRDQSTNNGVALRHRQREHKREAVLMGKQGAFVSTEQNNVRVSTCSPIWNIHVDFYAGNIQHTLQIACMGSELCFICGSRCDHVQAPSNLCRLNDPIVASLCTCENFADVLQSL